MVAALALPTLIINYAWVAMISGRYECLIFLGHFDCRMVGGLPLAGLNPIAWVAIALAVGFGTAFWPSIIRWYFRLPFVRDP